MKWLRDREWQRVRRTARWASVLPSVAGAWSMLLSFVLLRNLSKGSGERSWP